MTLLALLAIICFGFATYNLTCAFVDIPTIVTPTLRFAPLVLYMGTTGALRENFSISVIAGLPVTLM